MHRHSCPQRSVLVLSAAPTRSDLEGQQRPFPCRGRLSIEAPTDRRALPGESEARARGSSAGAFHQQIHPKGRTPRQTPRARARPHRSKTRRGSCIGSTTDRVCTCHQPTMVLYWHANLRVSVSVSGLVYHPDGRPHLDSARSAIERGSMRLRCHLTSSAQCHIPIFWTLVLSSFFPGGRALLARARRRGRRSVGVGVKDLRVRGPADRAACAESKNGILLDSVCLG